MSDDTTIDIRQSDDLVFTCPSCGLRRRVSLQGAILWAAQGPVKCAECQVELAITVASAGELAGMKKFTCRRCGSSVMHQLGPGQLLCECGETYKFRTTSEG